MTPGFTFDTGLLIALERRAQRARDLLEFARKATIPVTVPAPVVTEWWRGRTDRRETMLRTVRVEALTEPIAKLAGEALAVVRDATAVDAIVMASASLRGDVIYTSDFDDLSKLAAFFPGVRVLTI